MGKSLLKVISKDSDREKKKMARQYKVLESKVNKIEREVYSLKEMKKTLKLAMVELQNNALKTDRSLVSLEKKILEVYKETVKLERDTNIQIRAIQKSEIEQDRRILSVEERLGIVESWMKDRDNRRLGKRIIKLGKIIPVVKLFVDKEQNK